MISALSQILGKDVPRETFERLKGYVELLKSESEHQNLVSRATLDQIWDRHILDSAQLVSFEPQPRASWLDIGSGAGLPGIVIACLVDGPVTLVEPRRLRAEFLHRVAESLGLTVRIVSMKVERLEGSFEVITARAVASLSKLFEISAHLSTGNTLWALPKGRGAAAELVEAQRTWQGDFRLEPSITDPDSFVVVATGVRAKAA